MPPPQAFISSYAPRLRAFGNSLLTPVIQPSTTQVAPASRTTKRGTVVINYSEDLIGDDDDFDDSEGPRRPTGLRSRREDPNQGKENNADKLGKELTAPVEVQGIWRDWMGKPKFGKTDKQLYAQTTLPLTLIPIRIDIDIPSFTPPAALPLPSDAHAFRIDENHPAYRTTGPTPSYRLKDVFLWNLHETLVTPDQFALIFVHDLDLPNATGLALEIIKQIRTQLEEYAGVALHPLFDSVNTRSNNRVAPKTAQVGETSVPSNSLQNGTPSTLATDGVNSSTQTHGHVSLLKNPSAISAVAKPHPEQTSNDFSPDDTYRCIVTLNVNLLNKLYTDKFEWSLLHPPGFAEIFAKQTCADIGLAGEWVPAMAHAIYEAVLKLKKEAIELGLPGMIDGQIDNLALDGQEAGWRFDNEHLADDWEPKVEVLSKEEIEKREGDRERQIRRVRRETARFSTTSHIGPSQPGYFDQQPDAETPMGRGERSKKKRRFRSLSPLGRGGTPGGTPDTGTAGYGGGGGTMNDWERSTWRCSHCLVHGSAVWAVRDGPNGPRSLCNNCGLLYERDKRLPPWSKDLHRLDVPIGTR